MDQYGKSWETYGEWGRVVEDGNWSPIPRHSDPEEGGDQEGQPPVLDPNAQPMPMSSPDQSTGLDPDAKPMPMPSPDPHEPVPYEDYIPFFPMVKDPATGEWRNAEAGEIPGVGEQQLPPASQTPEAEPPVQPTTPGGDDGDIGGPGVPYEDYIPFWPMTQDPAAGQWRNMTPDEIEGPHSADPGFPQALSNLFAPAAPGPTLDPDLFNPNAPGPTLDPAQLERGNVEPGGVAEPADVTGQILTDPGLTEPSPPEPTTTPGQDHLHDPLNLG